MADINLNLRAAALDIFRHTLRAADARTATRDAVIVEGSSLRVCNSEFDITGRKIYVVALGKAAIPMTFGLQDSLATKIDRAIISGPRSASTDSFITAHDLFYGGHPLPNQQSLDAAAATFALLQEANKENGLVIFLVSGGGSAMLESPISKDLTLADLQAANRQLVLSGANISEINSVRRAISAVKGGRLATQLSNADSITLIVSDTNPGDEANVASGPTLPAPVDAPDPSRVIDEYRLTNSLPVAVVATLRKQRVDLSPKPAPSYVLLDNAMAMNAAAERAAGLGFSAAIACDINEQPIGEGSNLLLARARSLRNKPSCLISGGEFSCRVTGSGQGGRNLETALRCAIKIHDKVRKDENHTVVLSAGTDGIDGSSFAAGAVADETTFARAVELGLDPAEYLAQSNSHAFFEALDDLIVTGPTGTNVRDIRIVLRA